MLLALLVSHTTSTECCGVWTPEYGRHRDCSSASGMDVQQQGTSLLFTRHPPRHADRVIDHLMAEQKPPVLQEILPKTGLVVSEKGGLTELLCKPKIMPLKSITLQKLEEMEAQVAALGQQQQAATRPQTGLTRFT